MEKGITKFATAVIAVDIGGRPEFVGLGKTLGQRTISTRKKLWVAYQW
jgi:hypothetical protein